MPYGWLVVVKLPTLAKRLAAEQGKFYDEMDAASWLVRSFKTAEVEGGKEHTEPSPFAQCSEWSVFYCESKPAKFLKECEIESVERVPRMRRGRGGALVRGDD